MSRLTHKYKLATRKKYIHKDGIIYFELESTESITEKLKSFDGDNWVKYEVDRKRDLFLPLVSGIYAIVLTDVNTNKYDIAYIGCSKNLTRRFLSHETLHFLRYGVDLNFKIDVYIHEVDAAWRGKEKTAISLFKPFLNKESCHSVIEYSIKQY